jgi:hypothetical protein
MAKTPKVILVRDRKRLEIRHLGFAASGSCIQGVFAGPDSLDAPEPSAHARLRTAQEVDRQQPIQRGKRSEMPRRLVTSAIFAGDEHFLERRTQ